MKKSMLIIIGISLLSLSACTHHVFNHPLAISTKSEPAKNFQPIKTVRVTQCNSTICIIPMISDPRDLYDDLLAEAKKVGGTAVIDIQVHNDDADMCLPIYSHFCIEATGTAVRSY